MSHFTEIATQIKDLACLKRTLKELGYNYRTAEEKHSVWVRGWNNTKQAADIVVNTKSSYDIGINLKADGSYEFVADWWGVESHAGFTQEEFSEQVLQKYSYNKVMEEISHQGFTVVEEKQNDDQALKVVVRKWA